MSKRESQDGNPATDKRDNNYSINKQINVHLSWDKKTEKKIADFGDTWGQLSAKDSNATAIKTGNGMVVIDIDTKNMGAIDKNINKLLPSTPTVETARGYHYYFEYDGNAKYSNSQDKVGYVDVRGEGGLVFNSYTGNSKHISYKKTGSIYKLTSELNEWLTEKVDRPKSTYTGNGMSKKEVKHSLDYINILDYANRDSWMKVLAGIHDALGSEGEKIAREWSQSDSEQYDEGSFDGIWLQLECGQYGTGISAGTLIHEASKYGYVNDYSHVFPKREGCVSVQSPDYVFTPPKVEPKDHSKSLISFKGLGMLRSDYKKIANQKYFIKQFLPMGGLFMFAGDSGSGKSWLAFMVTKRVLESHKDASCIFVDLDSGATYTKKRVYSIWDEFGEDRFTYVSQTKTDSREVVEHLKNIQNSDLTNTIIVIDSLVGITDGNINESNVIKPILTLFEGLRNAGATVILIHHTKKAADKDSIPIYAGSFTIKAAMDALYMVSKVNTTITCHLSKARGDYVGRTFDITNFEGMEANNVNYISPEQDHENRIKKSTEYENRAIRDIVQTSSSDLTKTGLKDKLIKEEKYTTRRASKAVDRAIKDGIVNEKVTKKNKRKIVIDKSIAIKIHSSN